MAFLGPWRFQDAFDSVITPTALQYSVPAALVKGIIGQESAFKPEATGAINERGLMQLTERTARALGHTGHLDLLYDVRVNIPLGVRLLNENFRQSGGKWDVAIAAYNAGWNRNNLRDARRNADGTFTNQGYVDNVLDNWAYFDPRATVPKVAARGVAAMPGAVTILGIVGLILAWLFGRGK